MNYGSVLRGMLMDGVGGTGIHVIDPTAQPFADALATGAITCFRVGSMPSEIIMRSVASLDDLAPLGRGRAVAREEIVCARRWSVFVREGQMAPSGFIELGELFDVHRGQVTGNNEVWVDSEAGGICRGGTSSSQSQVPVNCSMRELNFAPQPVSVE